jgi:hypothetical protein
MSAPSSVPCPEPMPYSDEIYGYSDIDFTVKNHPIYSAQPAFVPIDKILSNQLGPVTNPVLSPSTATYDVKGFPILPEVESSNAKPLLSSYAGAEINLSTTLANNNLNFMSVNDITNTPQPVAQPVAQPTQPVPNVVQPPSSPLVQKFTNINKHEENNLPKKNNNISNFIVKENSKNNSVEHFKGQKTVEHFGGKTVMDNVILFLVIATIIYFMSSIYKSTESNFDTSKIPIVAQLTDNNVSNENKLIIVVAIVVAFVLIQRMLK